MGCTAATAPPPRPDAGLRAELGRLAALVGVAGLAIGQPLLDTFGKSPETFIFRHVEGATWSCSRSPSRWSPRWWSGGWACWSGVTAPRWRMLVHGASIGVFVGLAVVQPLAGLPRPLAIALAAVIALAAWVLTARAEAFRLWGQFLAGLPVFALVAFLFASPTSDLLASSDFTAAAGTGADGAGGADRARRAADGVDHRRRRCDRRRALPEPGAPGGPGHLVPEPHDGVGLHRDGRAGDLHRPAARSRWRRCSRSTPTTSSACSPGSHDLVVSEALTRLCPTSVCGDTPQRSDGDRQHRTMAAAAGAAMGELFGDALDVWLDRIGGADDR